MKVRKYPPVAQLDNAADSDSEDRGFESLRAGQKRTSSLWGDVLLARWDSNPERVRDVNKTVLGTVFSLEVCSSLLQRRMTLAALSLRAGQKRTSSLWGGVFLARGDSNPENIFIIYL